MREDLRVPERDRFLLGDAPLMASGCAGDAVSPCAPVRFKPEAAMTALAFCFPSRIALFSLDALSGPLMLVGAFAGWTAPSLLLPFVDAPWAGSRPWESASGGEGIAW